MNRQIMYMEDNGAARDRYSQLLRDQGFEVTVCSDKKEAVLALRTKLPDLALLDVSHHGDRDAGYEVCSEIRRVSAEVPVVFLTNRHGEVDRISGFRLGADDYISKDASMDYVVIRIEALLRRLDAVRDGRGKSSMQAPGSLDIELDDVYSTVSWKGCQVDMPLTQFWILRELCSNPGQVRSHRDLMKAANIVVEPNTITAHVKAIRNAFASLDPAFHSIRTERGRGYRWVVG
ncbi:MAG: response regulator [Pseudomonadales bacterium]|nr:response regulator [Halioglobus sp.]MCP5128831.1 response regulator [Pseudomonadales bacterium]